MKKMLLTGAMALMGLMVSAQGFMVTADIDMDDFTNFDGITETIGFGYSVNDAFVVGAKMANEDFDVFARYYWNENIFLSATAPTKEITDNLTVGAGYSLNVWNSLYVEPNVSTALKSDEDREFNFGLGVAFRF
jgi:predicted porin